MNLIELRNKLFKNGYPTPLGWVAAVAFVVIYLGVEHLTKERRHRAVVAREVSPLDTPLESKVVGKSSHSSGDIITLPDTPFPAIQQAPLANNPVYVAPIQGARALNQPSFGNLQTSNHLLSEDFLPKGTMLFATLTSDIVSNNQVSPATATVIHPAIIAHKMLIPVGTRVTGKISPGNLRGRVFVNWDTLIFYEEGRQGWELPIKGIGMTYEQNEESGRWIVNGAGVKGYLFDDSTANAFKLASIKAMEDFAKTLQTFVTTQNSAVTSGSVVTTTTTTPEATLQNSGLGAAVGFLDVIAQRYQASLQQQNTFVLVPTARPCAIFLDEPIDLLIAAPGRSIQASK